MAHAESPATAQSKNIRWNMIRKFRQSATTLHSQDRIDNPARQCIARYNGADNPRERIVNDILIGKSNEDVYPQARHGMTAGATAEAKADSAKQQNAAGGSWSKTLRDWMFGTRRRQGTLESLAKSTARNMGGQLGRSILRGVLGPISRK